MNGVVEPALARWRTALAAGLVSGDVSPTGIARAARVPVDVAVQVLQEADAADLLVDGTVPDGAVEELVALLDRSERERIHATTALHLLTLGPDHVDEALHHARAAGTADQTDLLRLLCTSGRMALVAGDCAGAVTLLGAAIELGAGDDAVERARLRFDLARALDGSGRLREGREEWLEVVRLASAAGAHDLVVDAAIRSVFPPDWRAGDPHAAAVLHMAEQVEGTGPRAAGILAARAMVEMRLPATEEHGHQVAWVTRTEIAQPLAERAMTLTEGAEDADRLVALTAWRQTHRAPSDLERRLAAGAEAMDLAQRLHDHERLADAAVASSIDRLEAADRPGHDECLAILRWLAATDDSPRVRWWHVTVAAGAAMHDGDAELADRLKAEARSMGRRHELPGWLSADILLGAEATVTGDDPDELAVYLVPVNTPIATSPVARSMVVWAAARLGELELARQHARVARRVLDDQQSSLLCLTLLARAASWSGDRELASFCVERLSPWQGRVAVDGAGWWCHGPVDLALAELAASSGSNHDALAHLHAAEQTIAAIGDVRSAARVERVRRLVDAQGAGPAAARRRVPGLDELTDRELRVLALLAEGRTNAEIATTLTYSTSTIRVDTMSIYRKLGVHGRVDAAALAVAAGLTDPARAPHDGGGA